MPLGLGIVNEPLETPTDWMPLDEGLGANNKLWLQNNVNVTSAAWLDSGPNENNAEQTSEGNRPSVSADGGLSFDQSGIAEFMDFTKTITISNNVEFTIAAVVTLNSFNNIVLLSDSIQEFFEIMNATRVRFKANDPSQFTTILIASSPVFTTDTKIQIIFIRDSVGNFKWIVDGVTITPTGSSSNTTNNRGFDVKNLGSRNDADRYFDGIIHEMLFYDVAVGGGQLTRLSNYLNNKFSIG